MNMSALCPGNGFSTGCFAHSIMPEGSDGNKKCRAWPWELKAWSLDWHRVHRVFLTAAQVQKTCLIYHEGWLHEHILRSAAMLV
jgi:hypothetical protein